MKKIFLILAALVVGAVALSKPAAACNWVYVSSLQTAFHVVDDGIALCAWGNNGQFPPIPLPSGTLCHFYSLYGNYFPLQGGQSCPTNMTHNVDYDSPGQVTDCRGVYMTYQSLNQINVAVAPKSASCTLPDYVFEERATPFGMNDLWSYGPSFTLKY